MFIVSSTLRFKTKVCLPGLTKQVHKRSQSSFLLLQVTAPQLEMETGALQVLKHILKARAYSHYPVVRVIA